ncbi:MAG: tRNA uridine-5-carboxymethylaminomethyl(34) synthesis GTPase MnmE [Gemmatimonadetes bacterium]|nr:tRNA uridine-5-carboxymethylaminomethyl(34) synthesis GTPase MnmE [Gemmatimonadota bacterium]
MGASASGADLRGDTIAAVATAAGRAALAVVRLSGPAARTIAARVGVPTGLEPRKATRARLHQPDRPAEPLDEAVVTLMAAPRSFTGEDMVEFSVHGGTFVSRALLVALVAAGARPARAGEFTERAVLHGKLDLLQAEAIADLIEARSAATHRAALRQLGGALSHRLGAVREALLEVEALIAYEIDFPEEDDGPLSRARTLEAASRAGAGIDALLATLPSAELAREGLVVVLAGAPNTGKSSLFNTLAGDARAIVSAEPGTTRDALELLVDDEPLPIRFVDTAGLRESVDVVERLGVEVSLRRLAGAHAVLVCAADDAALIEACEAIAKHSTAPRIAVRTKADLLAEGDVWSAPAGVPAEFSLAVSATTGAGLPALREAVRAIARTHTPDPGEEHPVVMRARHVSALRTARAEVALFAEAWNVGSLPAPVAGTHLRAAVLALDELMGGIDAEEVLGRVFSSFCVGK